MTSFRFTVLGEPAPKGSSRAFARPGGGAVLVPGGSKVNREKVKSWDVAVAETAKAAMAGREIIAGPCRVDVIFRFNRPRSHFGSGKNAGKVKATAPDHHTVKPDRDKLVRATLDAMTGIVYIDDAQACEGDERKVYASPGEGAGAIITVLALADGFDRVLEAFLPDVGRRDADPGFGDGETP